MKQLSEQELNQKIAHFLKDRFEAHPELARVKPGQRQDRGFSSVVSRVKNYSHKLTNISARTLYQGQ